MSLKNELQRVSDNPVHEAAEDPPAPITTRTRTLIDNFPYQENRYRCSVHEALGWPVITSHQTGRTVIFRWNELVAMARLKGIDLEAGEGSHGR